MEDITVTLKASSLVHDEKNDCWIVKISDSILVSHDKIEKCVAFSIPSNKLINKEISQFKDEDIDSILDEISKEETENKENKENDNRDSDLLRRSCILDEISSKEEKENKENDNGDSKKKELIVTSFTNIIWRKYKMSILSVPIDIRILITNFMSDSFTNLINCGLNEFTNIGVLGVGSFGHILLVKNPQTSNIFALKKIRKNRIIETGQQQHIINERNILSVLNCKFCPKLFGIYKDKLNIYFLMSAILGGELFTVLRWNKRFSEKTARFYAGCTILAFESLHSKNIIYRNLKPENLLISKNGYCKLIDFSFAKKKNNSSTFCGTPEYLAPEVIQSYTQTFAVDWWCLGIFIYEMLIGNAPFQDDQNVKMYEKILTYDVEFTNKDKDDDPKLTQRVRLLIQNLLQKNASQRLGSGTNGTLDILKHEWFAGLDWNKMREQTIEPPYIPNIQTESDVAVYDSIPDEAEDKLLDDTNLYKWCADF